MPTREEGFLQGHLGEISQAMVLGGDGFHSCPGREEWRSRGAARRGL